MSLQGQCPQRGCQRGAEDQERDATNAAADGCSSLAGDKRAGPQRFKLAILDKIVYWLVSGATL